MSQATLSDRPYLNSNLFTSHYLDERLQDREEWDCEEGARETMDALQSLYEDERGLVEAYAEDPLIDNWISEVLDILGFGTQVETTLPDGGGFVDVLLFENEDTRRNAASVYFDTEDTTDLFERGVGLVEAKQWDASFDEKFSEQRPYRNASSQIKHYLENTPENIQWGILTNGRKWRLYGTKDYEVETFYEVDLPELLETGDLEAFKYFYVFFRPDAFREVAGTTFLDEVYAESETAAQELGEDLQDNVFTALRVLGRGFIETNDLDIDPDDDEALGELKNQSLVLLYRLMFALYAEADDLIHPEGAKARADYIENFSLDQLRREIHDEIGEVDTGFEDEFSEHATTMWSRLSDLFRLIDEGEPSLGIPSYNGGLFDHEKNTFLTENRVSDRYLAEVIYRLSTKRNDDGRYVHADYGDLETRHLGSVYEGLLEHQFEIAPEQYAAVAEDGAQVWKSADEVTVAEAIEVVPEGGLYVVNDQGERKATGAYYTPDYVVTYIVEETVGPLVDEIEEELRADGLKPGTEEYVYALSDRVLDLRVLDPAMGSGHFLTRATEYLADRVMSEVREVEADISAVYDEREFRRKVAKECIYGVDINGMAVELAKLSMWLETLAKDKPLAFFDHHLKTGNSLVGSDVTEVLSNGANGANGDDGQLTLQQSFARVREQTLEHVMDLMEDLLAIDNETLADIKSMEEIYEEIRADPLYGRLFELTNVHTAEQFGIEVPEGAYEKMAGAIEDADEWEEIREEGWFREAQALAAGETFFHWELEFPEVFFGGEGEKLEEGGFDVVMGNPPYVQIKGDTERYLREIYQVTEYKIDSYHAFIEKGIYLSRYGGEFGFIVPKPWLTLENTAKLREYILENSWIRKLLQFEESVFEEATVDTVILILTKLKEHESDTREISVLTGDNSRNDLTDIYEEYKDQQSVIKNRSGGIEIRQSSNESDLIEKVRRESIELQEVASISIGIQAYGQDDHTKEQIENRVFHSKSKESADHVPLLSGNDVRRYQIKNLDDTWIEYGEHLHREREWRFFNGNRLFIREITGGERYKIHAASISRDAVCYKTVLSVLPENDYSSDFLAAIINSAFISWYFVRTSNKIVTDNFPRITLNDTEELPIPGSDRVLDSIDEQKLSIENISSKEFSWHELLSSISNSHVEDIEELENLNLSLLDHLKPYSGGLTLSEIGFPQPPAGVADSILTDSARDHPNLRVGHAEVIRKSPTTVEIRLTARYKPDPEEKGRDAYTETEPLPALEVTDLDEVEADLIEAFVPFAVDEAGGFADFRKTATKTNSLVDRLRKLTLPAVGDVRQGLESYVRTKERAAELEEQIERTDQLIDEIVYELYGLTDEEIEIVEEAVGD